MSYPNDNYCIEVDTNLYLGNKETASNGQILEKFKIKNVLSVLIANISDSSKLESIQYKFIRIVDTDYEDIISYFPECYEFISDSQLKGENVFVHCKEGRSRSVTILISFLMKKYGYDLEKSVHIMKGFRNDICPNEGFLNQLRLWQKMQFILLGSDPEYRLVLISALKYRLLLFNRPDWRSCVSSAFAAYNVKVTNAETNLVELDRGHTYRCKNCLNQLFNKLNLIRNIDSKDYCPSVFIEPQKWFLNTVMTNAQSFEQLIEGNVNCDKCQEFIGIFNWTLNAFICDCDVHNGLSYYMNIKINANKLFP